VRLAVVGHVEWCEFARVEAVPAAGEIVDGSDSWELPAGGGAVAAVQLAKLAGAALLFTALGDDELGRRSGEQLELLGLRVEAAVRVAPQRRAFVFVDARGERTITVLGEKLVPRGSDPLAWDELDGADAVFFVSGDEEALRRARSARTLVATTRALPVLARAGVQLDAVVGSGRDRSEVYRPGDISPAPGVAVTTAGPAGGAYVLADGTKGSYRAAQLPGPVADAYGCGDSFAAGLTFGLAEGREVPGALDLGARCGAACLTGRGPYAGQLSSPVGR
jgi:ribokinase